MILSWIALFVCVGSAGFIAYLILDGAPQWLWSLVALDVLMVALNVAVLAGAL